MARGEGGRGKGRDVVGSVIGLRLVELDVPSGTAAWPALPA